MRGINLDTYSLSLLTAKEDILNPRASTNWALFTYDGITNNLKLCDSGAGGVVELVGKFHSSRALYGLCRMGLTEMGQPRVVMICWVGENVDEIRRMECASHVPAVKVFFKEAHVFVDAVRPEDVTEEKIGAILTKVRPSMERVRRSSRSVDKEETVGTNYRKTNAAMEMRRINRDSFWARAEREEEQRKEEEHRRATEDRRRYERERVLQERKEAEERERKMNEKLQMIEQQRRMQAKLEAEVRKQEKSRWEQQQREHDEEMRARFRRSESIEKAAEAAALVSQRSMNPRDFFRQLSSSSQSPSSPGSPRTVKPPFRRYQRSLTDTAFIFEKTNTPTSPLSPTLVSPFSRTPTSPFSRAPTSSFNRSMSPPSPVFRPISSPQRPSGPALSPPTSPPRSAPPASSLPGLPSSRPPPPQTPPPTQPSAPPASPGLLASLARASGPASPTTPPPTAPPPETAPQDNELYMATRMLSDLEPEADLTVKAVLVEEDEVKEEGSRAGQENPSAASPPPSDTEPAAGYAKAASPEEPELEPSVELPPGAVSPLEEVDGPTAELPPRAVGHLVEVEGPAAAVKGPTAELVPESQEQPAVEAEEYRLQADQSDVTPAEPIRVEVSEDSERSLAELPADSGSGEAVEPSENGTTEAVLEENRVSVQNGTERCMEPLEPSPCTVKHDGIEEDLSAEDQKEEKSENGVQSSDGQLSVRALYDYQAEDESELSFEPGDIISAVETVDKAWWRGCSKDGRQGLFPANYVETI